MTRLLYMIMLLSLALGMNSQAAAKSPSPVNQLFVTNNGRKGTVVKIYTDGEGTYQAVIKTGERALSTPPEISYPPPRISWLSTDLLKIDFGSDAGADVRSVFYSARRNEVEGPYPFVKAVDPARGVMLCAEESVYFQKIFGKDNEKLPLKLDHLSTAAFKWFVVDPETRFIGNKLHVKYMTDRYDNDGGKEEWVSVEAEIPTVLLHSRLDSAEPVQVYDISEDRWVEVEGGAWVPGADMISRIKDRIEPFVRAKAEAKGRKLREWKTYTFQYQGRKENGKKFIFINAFCFNDEGREMNKRMVQVMDGGTCFFNLRYDVEKARFFDLSINGEA